MQRRASPTPVHYKPQVPPIQSSDNSRPGDLITNSTFSASGNVLPTPVGMLSKGYSKNSKSHTSRSGGGGGDDGGGDDGDDNPSDSNGYYFGKYPKGLPGGPGGPPGMPGGS